MQIFDAVARHLSFSRAAEELHLSQPAVSLQIKQLEGLVGLPLFEQMKRRLFVTAAGETVLEHARAILTAVNDGEKAVQDLCGRKAGGLRIAVISTAKYFAPSLLSEFLKGYPGVELILSVANREKILEMLQNNEVDLAIMGRPPTDFPVIAETFARHPMVMVAAPNHPLVRRTNSVEDFSGETFLMREQGSGTRTLMEAMLYEHKVIPSRTIEMSSNETIKQAVMAGMGVSLLSLHTIGLESSVGLISILTVKGLPIVRDWYVVRRVNKHLLPVAQSFVDFLHKEGAERVDAATKFQMGRRNRSRAV
jgi:DNA-binding transcriptional LysR family regulator